MQLASYLAQYPSPAQEQLRATAREFSRMTAEEANQKGERHAAAVAGSSGSSSSSSQAAAARALEGVQADHEVWRLMALNCHVTGQLSEGDAGLMMQLMVGVM